jgi:NAD(P)H dehydrogenase (quinone)
MTVIAVTGATGQLGGRVARRLAADGATQRLIVRDVHRAPRLAGAELRGAEYGNARAVRLALEGADTVLMVSAAETPERVAQHRTFIDAATDVGVGHLVYISFYGASPTATFTLARDHWATEEHARASGLPFTFLRDNIYADFLPSMVGADGVIRGPAAQGRVAAVAQDDIAEVAASVLLSPGDHRGMTHDLTGPQALSLAEVAAIVATATGRAVTYHAETLAEAYASAPPSALPTGRSTRGSRRTLPSLPVSWRASARP